MTAQRPMLDLLRAPILGAFLRWRHARTVLQATCLGLAALIILDGLVGSQVATRNLAGTLPWVHWRGFLVLGLLLVGNLFCMACPFMLPRRLAKRYFSGDRRWPGALGSKWVAVALLLLFLWAYEAFDLWASPWLTAWIAVTYFVLAFTVDAFFRGAAFCKHVCPIGQFNFVNAMVSPTEVSVRDPEVCDACRTKDCIRGRYDRTVESTAPEAGRHPSVPGRSRGGRGLLQVGCELSLFQPRKVGNLDCTYCLECVHACPHDNVGILVRSPLRELSRNPVRSGIGRVSGRTDFAVLAGVLVFGAFFNAYGMIGAAEPVRDLVGRFLTPAGPRLGPLGAQLVLAAIGLIALPGALVAGAAWLGRRASDRAGARPASAATYIWALVPLGFSMWTAHYLYHFLSSGLAVVPVLRDRLSGLGLPGSGIPSWALGTLVPEDWLLPMQLVVLQLGGVAALTAAWRIAVREAPDRGRARGAFLPWAALIILMTVVGVWILLQPMEMRGSLDHIMEHST